MVRIASAGRSRFPNASANFACRHGEDTILSFQNACGSPHVRGPEAASKLVKWRWLGLRRHFPRDKATGRVTLRYGEHNGKGGLEAASSQYVSNTASASSSPSQLVSVVGHLLTLIRRRTESYHVLHVYQSPDCERPLLPSEPLERPLRPAWFATFAHVLPFPSPNPGRAGSEVSTSLVAMPIRGGRICVWNPDTAAMTRSVPAVAWRAGSEIEKKAVAGASAALAAVPSKPAPPPPQAVLAVEPTEIIDVDMLSVEGQREVPDIKPQVLQPVASACTHAAFPATLESASLTRPLPPRSPVPVVAPAVPSKRSRWTEEPYSVVDLVGNGEEEEELTSVTIAPGGGKWMVASSARGIHIWALPI